MLRLEGSEDRKLSAVKGHLSLATVMSRCRPQLNSGQPHNFKQFLFRDQSNIFYLTMSLCFSNISNVRLFLLMDIAFMYLSLYLPVLISLYLSCPLSLSLYLSVLLNIPASVRPTLFLCIGPFYTLSLSDTIAFVLTIVWLRTRNALCKN